MGSVQACLEGAIWGACAVELNGRYYKFFAQESVLTNSP